MTIEMYLIAGIGGVSTALAIVWRNQLQAVQSQMEAVQNHLDTLKSTIERLEQRLDKSESERTSLWKEVLQAKRDLVNAGAVSLRKHERKIEET